LEKEQQKMQVLFLWKRNNKNKKCCFFGKGTTKNASAIPLEKEQKNQKFCSFGKETEKNASVVPLEKEQQSEKGIANTKSDVLLEEE